MYDKPPLENVSQDQTRDGKLKIALLQIAPGQTLQENLEKGLRL